jgi:hypothetical protein
MYIAARKIDLKHSTDLSMPKKLLKENSITIDECIENVLNIYDFEARKNARRKTKHLLLVHIYRIQVIEAN